MKTPTLLGTIIFGFSILVTAIAVFRLDFIVTADARTEYFELFFIWIAGIVGGLGMGYGSRESFGYNEGNNATIIGGLGFIVSVILAIWMMINDSPPFVGIAIAFVGAILALIGLYIVVVSTQETY
ncbi:hypothetical protein CEE45_03225 [Candidatus Heimdallarchaeota archaeon B3_Heim]|nr:MAG: hypothetical protein CEE45_03225 [Candidatus Heimdallarchaeota archaeon B3_Heim]